MYLLGWLGFFGICTPGVELDLQHLDSHIRRRLRALKLQDWKTKRTIARKLIELGVSVPPGVASRLWGRKSTWALAHDAAVDRGLRNAYFAERGLMSLQQQWSKNARYIEAPEQLKLALG